MLDPAVLRDHLPAVRAALQNRGIDLSAALDELAALESERRRLIPELEGLKREQNAAGAEAGRARSLHHTHHSNVPRLRFALAISLLFGSVFWGGSV